MSEIEVDGLRVAYERAGSGHCICNDAFIFLESLTGDEECGLLPGQRAAQRRLHESGRDVRRRIRKRVARGEERRPEKCVERSVIPASVPPLGGHFDPRGPWMLKRGRVRIPVDSYGVDR